MLNRAIMLLQVVLIAVVCGMPAGAIMAQEESGPGKADGEEMILFQEIPSVFAASKYEQKVTEAPSSVSVVTAADIQKYGYRTLADVLRSVRSFYLTYDRNYTYIGVRGFGKATDYNTRILILVDGVRLNDNIYDGAYVGTESVIDIDLVDRIEVIRGPGSSLYGSNAFFAVVNVITKRGRDLQTTEVSGEAAARSTLKGRLTYGDKFTNGWEALFSGTAYDSKGADLYYPEYDSAATNYGTTTNTDYDRDTSLFTKLAKGDVTVSGAYVSRTKGIPTGAFGTDFNDPANKTVDIRSYADIHYEHAVADRTNLMARVNYNYYNYTGTYVYFNDPLYGALNRDIGYSAWWDAELKLTTMIRDNHRLIAGAEYQDNLYQHQKNYDVEPYALFFDDTRKSNVAAVYLQDEIVLARAHTVTAGVRYDHYSTFGGTTNPRLAYVYTPTEQSALKLLYGSAFRTPNAFELYWTSPVAPASTALKPERIRTYEIVYERYFGDAFHASIDGYYYEIRDLISQVSIDAGTAYTFFQNGEEATALGVECELDNKWSNGIEGKFSYTAQRTKDAPSGDTPSNSPTHLVKVNVAVPIRTRDTYLAAEEQYMSRRKTENGGYVGGFAVTNITVSSRSLFNHLFASASIYNLFDKRYADPVSRDFLQEAIEQDGRMWRVKLTYAF